MSPALPIRGVMSGNNCDKRKRDVRQIFYPTVSVEKQSHSGHGSD